MTASLTVLIDAHNVIHQDPALRALMRDPEIARRELERRLEGRGDCILFYDGGPGGVPDSRIRAGIRVEYAGSEEADDLIVRWLRAHPGRRHAVVSDDRSLRARCRA
ncbi:MAG: NYN domain-containing protein, partial [Planctomycetes bacterium]|nr:NYN domain-containing protein [Planctomycetota bacterium]